jgi:transcriptional regulator with XRE-family HTH domain
MALKENLVRYMKEKSLTIKELSKKTEISEPTLKRLRSKENTNPTLDVLMKISSILDIPVNNLISKEQEIPLFYQDAPLPTEELNDFILSFTRDTFSFSKGTKAQFKKYTPGNPVTKYIINKDGFVFEKVDGEKWLFRDEKHNNYSIDQALILAYIVKEIFEVNYHV